MKKKKTRKSYSQEFKTEAVKLVENVGISKASADLGVCAATLRSWKKKSDLGDQRESGKPSYKDLEKENRRLKRELGYMEKINEVLKKSTAIFSQDKMGDWK